MKIALLGAECEENLTLRYIRAALEVHGHTITQITFNAEGELEVAARQLADSGVALAGFSMVFTYRAAEFAAVARRSRELGFQGHLVAGGHFAAFNADALLRDVPAFDSVAMGEGEELMADLAVHLDDLAAVRGLVWRDASGVIHHNPRAEKPPELDKLPWPTRLEPPDAYLWLPVANVLASRGCTHACAFCSIAAWHRVTGGARFRLREPEAVAEEIAGLYQRGYRIFNFHDDNFFLQDKRQTLQRFWRLRGALEQRGVGKIAFAVKSRPDTVDEEVFGFLKEFGLFRVFLGVEAGTASSLHQLGRRQSLADNQRALEVVNRLDLHACFNLLLLNPDSTLEDFQANVAFLREHARNPMNFCRTEIYAGTPLEIRLRRQGRLLGDYWGYGYRMRDDRAQEAFELMYLGLAGRHYGDGCVHHLAMRVDFERQVLSHFWDCPASLRRRAKAFVRRVNLNSCDYLDEIARTVGTGFKNAAAKDRFLRGLSTRVRRDNGRFTGEAAKLVAEIYQHSQPRKRHTGMWQQDAAAVLISSLALATASSVTSQTVVDPPPPPIVNLANQQKALLEEKLLPKLLPRLPEDAPLRVRAVFGNFGQWKSGEVFNTAGGYSVALPAEITKQLLVPELKNTICETTFTKAEVAAVRAKVLAANERQLENLKRELEQAKLDAEAHRLLREELGDSLPLAVLADLGKPATVTLELTISKEGKVTQAKLTKIDAKGAVVMLKKTNTQAVLDHWQAKAPELRGKPWVLRYSAAELQDAFVGTHMEERVPQPPTHIFEMAPMPPKER
jgi:radical SAM superfamily enzyme YgiQ (UPF0313 family)